MNKLQMNDRRTLLLIILALAWLPSRIQAAGPVGKIGSTDGVITSTYGPFAYDPSGNVISIGSDTSKPSEYRYDPMGRLVWAATERSGSTHEQTYQYDVYGNRLSVTSASLKTSYAVVTATNGLGAGAPHYAQYDEAGNLTEWIPPGQAATRTYTYDALNMVVKEAARAPEGIKTTHYIYTADDERYWIFNTLPGPVNTSRYSVRDLDGRVLREYWEEPCAAQCSGTVFTVGHDYVYRGTALLADAARGHHYSLDHLGTPRIVTDEGGAQVGRHTNHPFGVEITNETPSDGPLRFTGHERDPDLLGQPAGTLDYMHARYYSSNLGRFLSVDPGRDWDPRRPQSWNMYAYVQNNPINRTDPTGKYTCRGSQDDCKQVAAALTEARKSVANLPKNSEERARLNAIVNLYGKPGQRNGVVVDTRGKGRLPGATASASMQGKTLTAAVSVAAVKDQVSGFANPNLRSELAGVLIHEGQHLFDFKQAGRMFRTGAETLAGERRANFTEAFMWKGLGQNPSSEIYTNEGGVNAAAIEFYAQRSTAMWCAAGGDCQ